MNDRIQQLAEQAFNKANDGTISDIKIPKEFIEKFAQLIVAECAYFSMVATDDHYDVEALYKHFGVEE